MCRCEPCVTIPMPTTSMARRPTACTWRFQGCSISSTTSWSAASTTARIWVMTRSTPVPSLPPSQADFWACLPSDSPRNFASAARVAAQLVQRVAQHPLHGPEEGPVIVNVNVPDLPDGQLRGIKVTRLGNRHRAKPIVRAQDPRGREVYWVGNAGAGQDAGPGTDFHAVAEGYASVTPLQIDLTRHSALIDLKRWLEIE